MSPTSASVFSILLVAGSWGVGGGSPVEGGTIGLLTRSLEKCGGSLSDLGTCLRVRAVGLLDRALHSGTIEINDYLSLAPDSAVVQERTGRALSDAEIEASLPNEAEAKEEVLDEIIADKLTAFVKSRSIKFRIMPDEDESNEEHRGKKDKKGYGMIAAMFVSMMVKLALAKLALIAGKALIISKMALMLSAVLGLKKLVGSGGESTQVVYATGGHEGGGGGGHGGDWGRSEVAYSAHARRLR